jgi:hypothetical protein
MWRGGKTYPATTATTVDVFFMHGSGGGGGREKHMENSHVVSRAHSSDGGDAYTLMGI